MKNMDIEKGRSIQSSTISAFFSESINNFTSLINKDTGEDLIKVCPTAPFLTLYGLKDSVRKELIPTNPTIQEADNNLSIKYKDIGELAISANVDVKLSDDKLIISCEIENHSNWNIIEILTPHIGGLYLGGKTGADKLVYPHHAGEITTNPVSKYGPDRKHFWRAASEPCGDHYKREINYCGLASMSWMYYYNDNNGIYIGSHDSNFPVTGIIAETSGDTDNPWMALGFRKYTTIKKDERKYIGEYVIAVSSRDWHYGAEIYREYLSPHLLFEKQPEFLENEIALNQCYNFKRTGVIENRFRDIPKLYAAGTKLGIRHMFIASWNRTGFDSFYPEYYPDMELGSAMEFRRGLEYVRDQGGFSTLYINARIFDLKSDFHSSVGEKMAIRNEKGEAYQEVYGPEHFTVNCPSDSLWREYLIDTAEFCYKAYGCDGIYLDQLASAEPFACYAKGHSHEDNGEFNQGYLYILSTLLERMRKYNENAYLMTENIGDIYSSYTWANLTWNGADYDESYNVFKYTFPERVQVNMVNPRSWEKVENREKWFYLDMHRAVSLGNILWMGLTTRLSEDAGVFREYAEKILAFRTDLQPLLKDAEFLDDKWISKIEEKCYGTCWTTKDNRSLLIISSDRDEPTKFEIQLDREIASISLATVDDYEIDIETINSKNISLTLSQHQMVRILISHNN